jgi:glycosyltransferase 2 family protein
MQKLIRAKLFFFLKIAVTIAVLFFIAQKTDFYQVFTNIVQLDFLILLILLFSAGAKIYLIYLNWSKFLQMNPDYVVNRSETFKSLMIGEALRLLIPGGYAVAGKMYFVKNKRKATLASIGMEVIIQVWTLLVFAVLGSVFYFQQVSLAIKLVLLVLILISPFFLNIYAKFYKKDTFRSHLILYKRSIGMILIRQSACLIITIFQYFIIIYSFVKIDIFSIFISVPLVLTANLIPISYAGLGFKETFAIEVFSHYNISAEIAVTCTLLVFVFSTILPALIGLFYILRKNNLEK